MGPASPSPPTRQTPQDQEAQSAKEALVNPPEIDLDDSSELTPENMALLLARAKRAGRNAAKKTRMAFDTTQHRTSRFDKKKASGSG